jgi:hypothetical protein
MSFQLFDLNVVERGGGKVQCGADVIVCQAGIASLQTLECFARCQLAYQAAHNYPSSFDYGFAAAYHRIDLNAIMECLFQLVFQDRLGGFACLPQTRRDAKWVSGYYPVLKSDLASRKAAKSF